MKFSKDLLQKYPQDPGVYLMKNEKNEILYIGKAKNLKSRLGQYFLSGGDGRKMIPFLREQISDIDVLVVFSEKEALLLENTLIKKHQPKYNVLLKDDKTFICIALSEHKWPLLRLVRYKGKPPSKGVYFGPYTSAKSARQTLDLVQKLFPLRQCSDLELATRQRPCLLYDIKRCIAPCVNYCTQQDYLAHVNRAKNLLQGKDKVVIKDLKNKMKQASDRQEYEKAQKFYDMICHIEHVLEVQHVDNPAAKDTDAIGIHEEEGNLCFVVLIFREGKLIGSEHFTFYLVVGQVEELLESFLLQHYSLANIPCEIILPHTLEDKRILEELFSEKKKQKVSLTFPKKGKKMDLLVLAQKNAISILAREKDRQSHQEKMLLDLQEILHLERFPRKIICFDTSNISGTDAVAAMVCFINGKKSSDKIRLFTIRNKTDDYSALDEVLTRYFTKQKLHNDLCDLLIVDGGKGQLHVAMKVLHKLDIASVDVIGVAKFEGKHTKSMTQEKVFLPFVKEPILIPIRSSLLTLLQRIRDEAHRVAITYHKKKRSKRIISTSLDAIEGIGPIKRTRLLQKFGSAKKIAEASDEELKAIKGITTKDIMHIRKFLS